MGNWLRPQDQNYLAKGLMDAKSYLLFDTKRKKELGPLCKDIFSAVFLEFKGEKVQKYHTIQYVLYPK